jgi:chemotaxis protein CheC
MSGRSHTPQELDLLREMSNIGAGRAATSLSELVGRRTVSLSVPRVEALPFSEVLELLGGPEVPVVGISLQVRGAFQGDVLLVFSTDDARTLAAVVTGRERGPLDEMGRSALKEAGNIVTSSYLNALASLIGKTLLPSVPALAEDMVGAVIDSLLIAQGEQGDEALVLVNEFTVAEERLVGYFLLLPGPGTLEAWLGAVKTRA